MFHQDILNDNQKEILSKLAFPSEGEFYLSGGTALALQLGHRTSIDFDFYSQKEFEGSSLLKGFQRTLPDLEVLLLEKDTVRVIVGQTELSFFYYDYPLLEPLVPYDGIRLASKKDIAAMKLSAIVQRGAQRDFIDIYYLLKGYSLEELLSFALAKFRGYQEMLILRALVYFEDAENEQDRQGIQVVDPQFSWEEAKNTIVDAVKNYQLGMGK